MLVASVNISEISSSYQSRIKPAAFLNPGRRSIVSLQNKGQIEGTVGEVVSSVFRPGIFKRIFVNNEQHGERYITASSMMSRDPLLFTKILSSKMTDNLEQMKLWPKMILVSCAGTIGETRLIGDELSGIVASQDIIRVVPTDNNFGFIYAYLSCPTINNYLQSLLYGSVVSRIEPETITNLPLVRFDNKIIQVVNEKIREVYCLRNEASLLLKKSSSYLYCATALPPLCSEDYDYYGPRTSQRNVSCFSRNIKEIGKTSLNAFNHSERIRQTKQKIECNTITLKDALRDGSTFSSSGIPNIEVKKGHGIMLINQKDIFDEIITGKYLSSKGVSTSQLVEYGEILIACDGTLGETELFCRSVFANEDLVGAFVSSHFIRMRTRDSIPSGYLFTWLNSDYGFRLIRNTQAGTKLCHPISKLLLDIPVPIVPYEIMTEIDKLVREAYTMRHKANILELSAIDIIEQEINRKVNN